MKAADKGLIGFFVAVAIISAIGLLVPGFRDGEATRGISGALHLPLWALFAFGIVISVAVVVIVLVNVQRRKSGRPPI